MPDLWLARHGETEWTLSRKHTGTTDLPLTQNGERQAEAVGTRLRGHEFALVLSSPLARARDTAELAGFPDARTDPDLIEWDYGDYEGVTTAEIKRTDPDWDLWRDGCPNGESAPDVSVRADRVLERVADAAGPVLLFGHGHMTRSLAARALGWEVPGGRWLKLSTATLSIIGSEHGHPAVALWNDASHLGATA
jgi:probable phosphoglycerate mutase